MQTKLRRGLIRLAIVLMVIWNFWIVWYSLDSINQSRQRSLANDFDVQMDCRKTQPRAECKAEYDKNTTGYSVWAELGKEFTPSTIALVELGPPILFATVCLIIWVIVAIAKWVLRGFGMEFPISLTSGEPTPPIERLRAIGVWLAVPRNVMVASFTMLALSISYYFVISLPASNREKLQFEKESAEKKESEAKQKAEERRTAFESCENEVNESYWSYVKLNGKPVPGKPGTYNAVMSVWNIADKRKADGLAECHRQHDK